MNTVRDKYAEMYVAALLADADWDVYFPRRDRGFDMIVSKREGDNFKIRPVQVKGLYPTEGKKDRLAYGYTGKLTALHDDMVLALVYFNSQAKANIYKTPAHIAWMPRNKINVQKGKGFKCTPANLKSGEVMPRRDFLSYFDSEGLKKL